jgi:Ca-activated chloride channel family protein
VTALSKDQITVLDEKAPVGITLFEQADEPASIGLVFDMSRGNQSQLLAHTRKALLDFVARSEKAHEYFIIGFDRDAYLASDWARTPEKIAGGFDRLAGIKPPNKWALYDALSAALRKVGDGAHPKRVVILISDGRDNGSKLGRAEVLEQLRRINAVVYTVSVKTGESALSGTSDYVTLNKLCAISGGFASYPCGGVEFYEFFERLSVELKNQYTVGFIPTDTSDSGWRRLDFKAKTLEVKKTPSSNEIEKILLSVRSREGYYPSR